MHQCNELNEYLTLGQAASMLPNRPGATCVWRWCRHGVLPRGSAKRITLQHVRVGGRIYTTARWLEQFATRLAAADSGYFSLRAAAQDAAEKPQPRQARPLPRAPRRPAKNRSQAEIEEVRRELERAGL